MKKLLLLSAAIILLCALFSCGGGKGGDESLYFELESLPDIGDYTPEPAPDRWYEDYTDTLIPREDYGPLRPYCGNIVDFSNDSPFGGAFKMPYFGLCTEDGVIVTDPVFTGMEKRGDWYILQSKLHKKEDASVYLTRHGYTLAKADGSVCIPLEDAVSATFISDDMISVNLAENSITQILDTEGNILAELQSAYIRATGSYIRLTEHGESSYDGNTYAMSENGGRARAYLLDSSLNIIAGPKNSINCLGDKLYRVNDGEYYNRIYSIDGTEVLTHIRIRHFSDMVDGMFLVADLKNAYIYDYDLNLLSSMELESISSITLLGKNLITYKRNENTPFVYIDLRGNELKYEHINVLEKYCVMYNDGVTYIADEEMNILAETEGKYACYNVDPRAELVYLTLQRSSDSVTSAYSMKTKSFVAENVYPYLYIEELGFYCKQIFVSETGKYRYEIYRSEDHALLYKGNGLPDELRLGEDIIFSAELGDFAVTYDKSFKELFRIRINND